MKTTLLLSCLLLSYSIQAQTNLVSNGNVEQFTFPDSTPDDWSSSSDFGDFSQNTTDFIEGSSSVQFDDIGGGLMMFTIVDIPLENGKTYDVKYSYKYLGSDFDANDNIEFKIISGPTVSNPFIDTINIQDNNWNTVQIQFSPTITNSDYAVEIEIQNSGFESPYQVLFDDIQIVESPPLSNLGFTLQDDITLINKGDNLIQLKKSSNTIITNISLFSILGIEEELAPSNNQVFNLNSLSSGIYIFRISTEKGTITKKVLVL